MSEANSPANWHTQALRLALVLAAAALLGLAFNLVMPQGVGWRPPGVSHPQWQAADPARALRLVRDGAVPVDARDPGDYKTARLAGSLNLYPEELDLIWPLLKDTLAAAPTVLVYGRTTSRWPAAEIGQFLRGQGLTKVYVTEASYADLVAAGLPQARSRRRSR